MVLPAPVPSWLTTRYCISASLGADGCVPFDIGILGMCLSSAWMRRALARLALQGVLLGLRVSQERATGNPPRRRISGQRWGGWAGKGARCTIGGAIAQKCNLGPRGHACSTALLASEVMMAD